MLVQWYPGHMNKARKMMEADLKLIDLVIEIVDARCPLASRNPDIDKMAANKDRLVLLNKADLADNKINEEWIAYFAQKGIKAVLLNSKNKEGLRLVMPAVREACAKRYEKNAKRGIKNTTIRAMVCGIPNVGKSTFINAFCGKNMAKTGNKPGVTVGKQWIKINLELEFMDTPGILWPKFEDQRVGMMLAYIGSINDEILVREELAGDILVFLYENYKDSLKMRYNIDDEVFKPLEDEDTFGFTTKQALLLGAVAMARGCIKRGAEPDIERAANVFLEEFRNGKIGRISLERPLS